MELSSNVIAMATDFQCIAMVTNHAESLKVQQLICIRVRPPPLCYSIDNTRERSDSVKNCMVALGRQNSQAKRQPLLEC